MRSTMPYKARGSATTKPKVTGSNPVGRALRMRWISLNGAKSRGPGEICPIRSKPPFLPSSRIGLSLKQAHRLRRDKSHLVDRLGALPHSQGRRFESGPRYVRQGDRVAAQATRTAVPIRPVVPGTARDASLSRSAGRRLVGGGSTRALPRSASIPPVLEYSERPEEARRYLPWTRRYVRHVRRVRTSSSQAASVLTTDEIRLQSPNVR